ncbi:hypothetical protein [Cognatilysobacter terrigena]|uniref:hypothetical protein n=1 Tax=Cognatilysobacter terrigena TaxID=2488749 RepID=UPI00105C4A82|nr:hypothetical protein [Lysobacter terrigena]
MASITVDIDSALYSPEVALRAAHRQSADCFVEVQSRERGVQVVLTPKGARRPEECRTRLLNDLVDEALRERVAHQTSALRDVLIEAALREAKPRK